MLQGPEALTRLGLEAKESQEEELESTILLGTTGTALRAIAFRVEVSFWDFGV